MDWPASRDHRRKSAVRTLPSDYLGVRDGREFHRGLFERIMAPDRESPGPGGDARPLRFYGAGVFFAPAQAERGGHSNLVTDKYAKRRRTLDDVFHHGRVLGTEFRSMGQVTPVSAKSIDFARGFLCLGPP